MAEVRLETELAAPPDDVWKLVSDFGGMVEAFGMPCTTEGPEGVGQLRTITMGEDQIVERLETLEPGDHRLQYSIVSAPLPVKDYVATMKLDDAGSGRTSLVWSAEFEPAGASVEDAKNIVNMVLGGAISGLQGRFGS